MTASTTPRCSAAFLHQQMQWREELEDARDGGGETAVRALAAEVEERRVQALARVAHALDEQHDYVAAAAGVRELHFIKMPAT